MRLWVAAPDVYVRGSLKSGTANRDCGFFVLLRLTRILIFCTVPLMARQFVLEFDRSSRAKNRGRKLGRPRVGARVPHRSRPVLAANSAVHVTLKVRDHVPNLRARDRFFAVRAALAKFRVGAGFRLVHWNVLGNHLHMVVEADSAAALSSGVRAIAHSISRRLSALNVARFGGALSTSSRTPFSLLRGWLGRVFRDRFHAHVLATPTEIAHAIRYVLNNAAHHGFTDTARHAFTSLSHTTARATPCGFLLSRASKAYPK